VSLDPPTRLPVDATIREAATEMERADTSSLMIGDPPSRIVTERDLVRGLAAGLPVDYPVDRIASPHPLWVTTSTRLVEALNLMATHRVRHLVVIRPTGEVAGILSLKTASEAVVSRLCSPVAGP